MGLLEASAVACPPSTAHLLVEASLSLEAPQLDFVVLLFLEKASAPALFPAVAPVAALLLEVAVVAVLLLVVMASASAIISDVASMMVYVFV
ncbi:hypothetical protein TIFTF001_042793 [Ficus carica]|uniref:Uncharacterized protein n=1 Tax=Ficus carica TaxID=3494 RepID=A0AA87YNM6_FICCA|nr:hypothetical protein TIFTF001_042793 [Ficus carica]